LPDRPGITCDVFFVADVNSPEAEIVQKWIGDAPRACRIALFHWPAFASDVRKPVASWAWVLSSQRGVTVISPGDILTAEAAIFVNAELAEELIDAPPTVKTKQLLVVEGPGNSPLSAPGRDRFAALFAVPPTFLSWEQAEIPIRTALSRPGDLHPAGRSCT
jgi:hypothetical protein